MGKRGAKSPAESRAVAPGRGGTYKPPSYLNTEEQKDLWWQIMATLPGTWFDKTNLPLLAEYVVALDNCRMLGEDATEARGEGDLRTYVKLLETRDKESRRAMGLATRMRITQQSIYEKKSAGTAKRNSATTPAPWLSGEENGLN